MSDTLLSKEKLSKATEVLIQYTVKGLLYLLIFLVGMIIHGLGSSILELLTNKVPIKSILGVLALALIIIILQIAYICYLTKKLKTKFKLELGIYWDTKKNPHCPVASCNKTPLTYKYNKEEDMCRLYCMSCDKYFPIIEPRHEIELTLPEAQKRIK